MEKTKLFEFIESEINNNDVVLFMKGTKDFPMCNFSAVVITILKALNVEFVAHNILANEDLRQAVKDYSDWPTLPQLYIKGEFIGGCDIVNDMYKSGELADLLIAKKISDS